jgi:hypothetical protein
MRFDMLSSVTAALLSTVARLSASFFLVARRSSFAGVQIGPQILQLASMAA